MRKKKINVDKDVWDTLARLGYRSDQIDEVANRALIQKAIRKDPL